MLAYRRGDLIRRDAAPTVDALPEGFVKGIASSPSTDLYGHRVMPRAFDASIRRKGLGGPSGIKLLLDHDSTKPAGVIKRLDTVNDALRIEAQLNLGVSYVADRYAIAKQNGGLSFSVGFILEEFDLIEDKRSQDGAYLIIKQGDLHEVSIVCFPAQLDATMELVKARPPMPAFADVDAKYDAFFAKARADQAQLERKLSDLRIAIRAQRIKAAQRAELERIWTRATNFMGNPRTR